MARARVVVIVAILCGIVAVAPAGRAEAVIDLSWSPNTTESTDAYEECAANTPSTSPATTGLQAGRWEPSSSVSIADGATIDATEHGWQMDPGEFRLANSSSTVPGWSNGENKWLVRMYAKPGQTRDDLCLLGPRVWSPIPDRTVPDDPETPWNDTKYDAYSWNKLWHHSAGIQFANDEEETGGRSGTVIGADVRRTGDGIDMQGYDERPNANPWEIHATRLTEIHDDCVEADEDTGGWINDSLLDGCWNAVASQEKVPSAEGSGLGNQILITDSLIRLQAMASTYEPLENPIPDESGFFKWDADSPPVVIENTVLRATGDAFLGNGPPQNTAETTYLPDISMPNTLTCTDATLVWEGDLNAIPAYDATPDDDREVRWNRARQCFDSGDGVGQLGDRITDDLSVWTDAKAAWEAAHPPAGNAKVPNAVAAPTVTSVAGGLTVSWSAATLPAATPAVPAVPAVQAYTVVVTDASGRVVGMERVPVTPLSRTLTSLDTGPLANGATYKVQIAAVNRIGIAPLSPVSELVIPPHAGSGSTAIEDFIDEAEVSFPQAAPLSIGDRTTVANGLLAGVATTPQVLVALRDQPGGAAAERWAPLARAVGASYGRPATQPEWTFALAVLQANPTTGMTLLADGMSSQPDFLARFPGVLSDTQFIDEAYDTVLGRAPTTGEASDWLDEMTSNGASRGAVVFGISATSEYADLSAPYTEAMVLRYGLTGAVSTSGELAADAATLLQAGTYVPTRRVRLVQNLMAHAAYIARVD